MLYYFIRNLFYYNEDGDNMFCLDSKKCLIAYFSHRGNNYVSGSIANLPVGNTEVAAKMIQEKTGGELFQIATVAAYPADYHETTEAAKKELNESARPALSTHMTDMDRYEVIFLGYPNWWGTMPMAVFTFLEKYNFTDKMIAPFCTHEGSGMGSSESDIKRLCTQAKVLNGLAIHGTNVNGSADKIAAWLNERVRIG